MTPVSDALLAAVTGSHEVRTRVEVIDAAGNVVRDISGALLSGSVSADASSATRRRASLVFSGDALDSSGTAYGSLNATYGGNASGSYDGLVRRGALLSPVSAFELRIARGVVVDGVVEWVPLGVFKVGSARVTDKGAISVSAFDRSRVVAMSGWTDLYVVPAGEPVEEVVAATVIDRFGRDVPLVMGVSGVVTPRLLFGDQRGGNPWRDVLDLAGAANLDVSFTADGWLRVTPFPDLVTAPVAWTVTAGDAGTLVSRDMETSDAGVFNGVVVVVEHPDGDTVRGEAWDDNPGSATYRNGPFGPRPLILNTSAATSAAAAQALAERKLTEVLGLDEEVSITSVPMPALDVNDVIRVVDAAARFDGLYVVTRVDIPLDVKRLMSVSARKLTGRTS